MNQLVTASNPPMMAALFRAATNNKKHEIELKKEIVPNSQYTVSDVNPCVCRLEVTQGFKSFLISWSQSQDTATVRRPQQS